MKHALARFASMCLAVFSSLHALAQATPPSLIDAVQRYVKSEGRTPSFRHVLFDLNGDGRSDAIVLFESKEMCGTGGCAMVVFRGQVDQFSVVSNSTITNAPIRVLPDRLHGWSTLIVATGGVGDVVMRFNGTIYPLNPSLQPKATNPQLTAARIVIDRRSTR